ncbi:MAG: phenylacetate--CoA ligase [Spirochaetes bacterium]|nr:phenylacetate--CoA ligase [Spirochaetota bacterium]
MILNNKELDLEINYFDKKNETLDREYLEKLQLTKLVKTVDQALKIEFYKKRLNGIGIKSGRDIKSFEDFKKIPFTSKDELRSSYPKGFLSVDMDDVIRLHTSSGTTGVPTVIYHTRNDIENWAFLTARCMMAAGATKKDIFQNMTGYGLFTGGLGMHYGAEKIGMTVIPAGSGNTKRQIQMMKDFKTTVVHATPSYMLHIYDIIVEEGINLSELSLKRAFLGAEPYGEQTRKKLEDLLKIDVYNSYGLSEMNGPGVSFECIYKNGMHTWEDFFILEIIDPVTGKVLEDGKQGEIVFTTLDREATPILRYRTKDLTHVYKGRCECGRVHRRISRITGRTDDMLIINGANVFPSQIEEVIMKYPEVGTNYQIFLTNKGALDKLTVKVEIYSKMFKGEISELDSLKKRIADHIKSAIIVNPTVELHEPGSLPVSEGKAKRVIDERSKL